MTNSSYVCVVKGGHVQASIESLPIYRYEHRHGAKDLVRLINIDPKTMLSYCSTFSALLQACAPCGGLNER